MNRDLIQYIVALLEARLPEGTADRKPNISFHKVKAHVGIEGNEMADRFAKNGGKLPRQDERDYEREAKKLGERKKNGPARLELDFEIVSLRAARWGEGSAADSSHFGTIAGGGRLAHGGRAATTRRESGLLGHLNRIGDLHNDNNDLQNDDQALHNDNVTAGEIERKERERHLAGHEQEDARGGRPHE